ncbi:DUF3253 domain-containing protein [Serinibacter arcticus]|uniref:DUF3253 domain-containing protein n=1 Tax=Serinibacter arcticus TaxID=1655435 RepID=A0A2U1ZS17_9MICO|nr:DUF3253 domain-containing protein [Serinibacter arcticus]PWD49785.1 DUF3253 domain-containing protein [Serinibacter arcticus]
MTTSGSSASGDEQGSGPETTPDGHHVVIDGRRWRATDPGIPDTLAAELRSALMTGRRGVGAAKRAEEDTAPHRRIVDDAKVALGERGAPWWEPATEEDRRRRIAATIRTLAAARAPGTTCPSDAARVVGGEAWRPLMPTVRAVAEELAAAGEIVVTQGGEPVRAPWRGPVRLGRPD